MEIIIRKAITADYERLSAIMDQVHGLHVALRPDVYRPATPVITREEFEDTAAKDGWYVAEADGVVAGILEIEHRHVASPVRVTKDTLYIHTMAVDEAYRGKGIGRSFFDMLKAMKADEKLDGIELQVNARNTAAYEMYRHCGFTEKSINLELL